MLKQIFYTILITSFYATAAGQPPANIFFRKLTQQQGLSKNSIWSTYRDKQGFLWIATSNGLNCYDGSNVTLYDYNKNQSNTTPVNSVRYITEDDQNRLWMSSETKIFFFNKKTAHFTNIDLTAFKNKVDRISHLYYASDGNIYSGQGNYLLCVSSKTLKATLIETEKDSSLAKKYGIYHFAEDKEGWLWFSNYPSLYAYNLRSGIVKKYPVLPGRLNNVEPVEAGSIVDDRNFLWLGMYSSGGLARFNKDDGTIQYYSAENYRQSYAVTAVAQDVKDDYFLWVGTKTLGLGLFDKRTFSFVRFYTRNDARAGSIISNNISASINFDADQTCWVSTTDGLSYFNLRNQRLETFYVEPYDGKNFNRYQYEYILKDKKNPGQILLSTKDNGIIKYDYINSRQIFSLKNLSADPEKRYKQKFIDWLYAGRDGTIWYSSLEGISILNEDGSSKKILDIQQFKSRSAEKLQIYEGTEDNNEMLWFATSTGLWKYNKKTSYFSFADTSQPLLKEDMFYIKAAEKGVLWIILNNHSIVKYNPANRQLKEWKVYLDSSTKTSLVPLRLIVDKYNNVWATSVEGLIHLDATKNSIRIYKEKDGLCSSSLLQIAYDGDSMVYAGSEGCVAEININNKSIKTYSGNDGLVDNIVRGGIIISGENLYIGGRNYIQVMNTNGTIFKHTAPLLITQLLANDQKINFDSSNRVSLRFSQNSIQIDYRLLDLLDEAGFSYEYRLLNFKNEWVKAGAINKALFFNLPAGKYDFEVRAVNRKTGMIAAFNRLEVKIQTPWWQSWWFRISGLLAVVVLLYYLYNIRISKLLAIERTRQRIGKDLHDDIGTALSSITLMNTVLKKKIISNPEDAAKLADKVEDTSRQMIQNMSDIVWSINPGNDTLEKLANRLQQFMNDAFDENETDYTLTVAPTLFTKKIDMETRKDAYLICKEIISNAAKYSMAKTFRLALSSADNMLMIVAEDDGQSFDIKNERTGNGLNNIQLRTQRHKGFADLVATPAKGTKWIITMKI